MARLSQLRMRHARACSFSPIVDLSHGCAILVLELLSTTLLAGLLVTILVQGQRRPEVLLAGQHVRREVGLDLGLVF